MQLGRR